MQTRADSSCEAADENSRLELPPSSQARRPLPSASDERLHQQGKSASPLRKRLIEFPRVRANPVTALLQPSVSNGDRTSGLQDDWQGATLSTNVLWRIGQTCLRHLQASFSRLLYLPPLVERQFRRA